MSENEDKFDVTVDELEDGSYHISVDYDESHPLHEVFNQLTDEQKSKVVYQVLRDAIDESILRADSI